MNLIEIVFNVMKIFTTVVDILLWLIFYFSALLGIIAYKNKEKFKIYSWVLVFFSLLSVVTIIYSTTVEQFRIVIKEESFDIKDYTGEPTKFIIISDLHVGEFLNSSKLPLLVNKINKIEDADYVLLLGDVVNESSIWLSDLDYLSKLNKEVIFIYGNHDYINAVPPIIKVDGLESKLNQLGFTTLENEVITIGKGESKIIFAGIKDLWSQEEDLTILRDINSEEPLILLSHSPDVLIDLADGEYQKNVDLVLSGHTHGGEVRVPIIGPIGPMPITLPRSYDKGFKEYQDIPIFITSGIGSTGTRVKLFNPSEIIILEIK